MDLPINIPNGLYLVLSLVGLISILAALRNRRQADVSQGWSGVQGKVLEARIEKAETSDSDGSPSTLYTPVVRYSYPVMGKEYTGERISFAVRTSNPRPASQIIDRYPAGSSVMVYYDPADPTRSVLERTGGNFALQVGVGIVLILAGLYYALR